jgi:hypothetical protein
MPGHRLALTRLIKETIGRLDISRLVEPAPRDTGRGGVRVEPIFEPVRRVPPPLGGRGFFDRICRGGRAGPAGRQAAPLPLSAAARCSVRDGNLLRSPAQAARSDGGGGVRIRYRHGCRSRAQSPTGSGAVRSSVCIGSPGSTKSQITHGPVPVTRGFVPPRLSYAQRRPKLFREGDGPLSEAQG